MSAESWKADLRDALLVDNLLRFVQQVSTLSSKCFGLQARGGGRRQRRDICFSTYGGEGHRPSAALLSANFNSLLRD